jgi:hypothetical protein
MANEFTERALRAAQAPGLGGESLTAITDGARVELGGSAAAAVRFSAAGQLHQSVGNHRVAGVLYDAAIGLTPALREQNPSLADTLLQQAAPRAAEAWLRAAGQRRVRAEALLHSGHSILLDSQRVGPDSAAILKQHGLRRLRQAVSGAHVARLLGLRAYLDGADSKVVGQHIDMTDGLDRVGTRLLTEWSAYDGAPRR